MLGREKSQTELLPGKGAEALNDGRGNLAYTTRARTQEMKMPG
jgi:hypothetical protein